MAEVSKVQKNAEEGATDRSELMQTWDPTCNSEMDKTKNKNTQFSQAIAKLLVSSKSIIISLKAVYGMEQKAWKDVSIFITSLFKI